MRGKTPSLAPGPGQADLDAAGGDLGVFFLADEVNLGGADVGVPREFPHLVHGRPVADRVVDGRFAQGVDADAASSEPRWVDASRLAVFLDQPPGRLAVQVP